MRIHVTSRLITVTGHMMDARMMGQDSTVRILVIPMGKSLLIRLLLLLLKKILLWICGIHGIDTDIWFCLVLSWSLVGKFGLLLTVKYNTIMHYTFNHLSTKIFRYSRYKMQLYIIGGKSSLFHIKVYMFLIKF